MAFMVPLVKNHYDIYARNTPPESDNLYLSTASLAKGSRKGTKVVLTSTGGSASGRKTTKKTIVVTRAPNGQARIQSSSISLPVAVGKSNGVRGSASLSAKSLSSTPPRPFPHVRRTVRNPITNRVYSYSVSIPDYVAEEDEEQLAQEEEEDEEESVDAMGKRSSADQILLFSTSAPAGTGSIGNGITCEDDEFVCFPTSLTNSSNSTPTSSEPSSSDEVETKAVSATKLRSHTIDSSLHRHNHSRQPSSKQTASHQTSSSPSSSSSPFAAHHVNHPLNHHANGCSSSNSREYVELLRKFILHLKMLKLSSAKRLFNVNSASNGGNNNNSDNNSGQNQRRRRKNTLDDSKNL